MEIYVHFEYLLSTGRKNWKFAFAKHGKTSLSKYLLILNFSRKKRPKSYTQLIPKGGRDEIQNNVFNKVKF